MPEFRQDPITGRCVIIASNRSNRPRHYDAETELAYSLECPFCEGNESMTPPEIYAQRKRTAGQTRLVGACARFQTNIQRLKIAAGGAKPILASIESRRELVFTK